MKTHRTLLTLVILLALTAAQRAGAIVGYVNEAFAPGSTLFANPLEASDNHLSALMPTAPDGASVMLWNSGAQHYDPAVTFSGGVWSANLLLAPGTGAVMFSPQLFTNTFIGTVLDANGGVFDDLSVHPPPPFAGPNGLYLLSNKIAASGTNFLGVTLFQCVLGRAPNENESFYRWNGTAFVGTTFSGGVWGNGNPFLNVGESGFFDVGGTGALPTIPEPSSFAIVILGLLGWGVRRCRR